MKAFIHESLLTRDPAIVITPTLPDWANRRGTPSACSCGRMADTSSFSEASSFSSACSVPAQNLESSVGMYILWGYSVGMKKINFYIPDPMLAEMQALAEKRDVALAELIRRAIEQFLAAQK